MRIVGPGLRLKGKRHVWGIQAECEGAFPKLFVAAVVIGVGSDVEENEGPEKIPRTSQTGSDD